MSKNIAELRKKIKALRSRKVADTMKWFFKTGRGEYGEGDIFAGLKVPVQRKIAKDFRNLSLPEIKYLLASPVHEERLISLLILVDQYEKGSEKEKEKIYKDFINTTEGKRL